MKKVEIELDLEDTVDQLINNLIENNSEGKFKTYEEYLRKVIADIKDTLYKLEYRTRLIQFTKE